ncbi:hypothetical protein AB6866_23045 [Rahnella inusitata]|uniref:hypothetical protein n=1 Tax=Rahnella inusitata TaxID=58169 RepID=UPI0039BDF21F
MNKVLAFLNVFFFSAMVNASVANDMVSPTEKESSTWRDYMISEPIISEGEYATKESISALFKGKRISIDKTMVNVSEVCRYKYNIKNITPILYWHSEKTVRLYSDLLYKYNIRLNNLVSLITPAATSNECDYPFTYFIIVDNSLIFSLKNRMIIYHSDSEIKKHRNSSDDDFRVTKKTPSLQADEYEQIEEVFNQEMDLINSYKKYRDSLQIDYKKHLVGTIFTNVDLTKKCDNGCIKVDYKWSGPHVLIIKQDFNGGETEIHFIEENHGTRIITKSYPD